METLLATVVEQARSLPGLELIAVAAAVLYLVLAIRQNIACWYFAALSSAIYIWLLFDVRLYMESALNVFYFAMAVYGWNAWRHGGPSDAGLPVSSWSLRRHLGAVAAIVLISTINGRVLETGTDAAFPYVDSLTTWAALWATFLVARKVLENWWYWLVIDVTLVAVFWLKGLQLTALLFFVYVLLIPVGYLSWRRSLYGRPELRA